MTGKPPHRPSGKTGAQEWERKDPATHKHAEPDVHSRKPYQGEKQIKRRPAEAPPLIVDEEGDQKPAGGSREGA